MEQIILNVSSVTNAMRAQTLLGRNGIRAAVGRVSDPGSSTGCGYLVKINPADMAAREGDAAEIKAKALRLLRAANIKVLN